VDLHEVHSTGDGGSGGQDQVADIFEKGFSSVSSQPSDGLQDFGALRLQRGDLIRDVFRPSAMMPSVAVPTIRSKSSAAALPVSCSSAANTAAENAPFDPAPLQTENAAKACRTATLSFGHITFVPEAGENEAK
jgi:hypothetical protein